MSRPSVPASEGGAEANLINRGRSLIRTHGGTSSHVFTMSSIRSKTDTQYEADQFIREIADALRINRIRRILEFNTTLSSQTPDNALRHRLPRKLRIGPNLPGDRALLAYSDVLGNLAHLKICRSYISTYKRRYWRSSNQTKLSTISTIQVRQPMLEPAMNIYTNTLIANSCIQSTGRTEFA